MPSSSESNAALLERQAARIADLEAQLQRLRHEHDMHRSYYSKLEAVCWQLLSDAESGRQQSEGERQRLTDAATMEKVPHDGTRSGAPRPLARAGREGEAMPGESESRSLHRDPSALRSFMHREAAAPCPCVAAPQHWGRDEAQALAARLWTLDEWLGDLVESLRSVSPSRLQERERCDAAPLRAEGDITAGVRERSSSPSKSHRQSAGTQYDLPARRRAERHASGHREPPLPMDSFVDTLFVRFTQLQAILTDTVWTTRHPPALPTPARTDQDSRLELTRLRAINQQLRRTVREYERLTTGQRGDATTTSEPRKVKPAPAPPSGYVASREHGLFLAQPGPL